MTLTLATAHVEMAREIRTLTARLDLISHGPTANLDKTGPRSTAEHPGGKRPNGEDWESPHDLEEWMDSKAAYQAKTPERYRAWLQGLLDHAGDHDDVWLTVKLTELRDDLRATLKAWAHPPIREDQPPTMVDPGFKRFVITCGWDLKKLVDHYGCTRQYMKRILESDWSVVRDESKEDQEKRERAEWLRRRAA